jgi:hypothetical protein
MFKAMPGSILHPILVHLLKIKKNIGSQMRQTNQKKIKKRCLEDPGYQVPILAISYQQQHNKSYTSSFSVLTI